MNRGPIWGCAHGFEWLATRRASGPGYVVRIREGLPPHTVWGVLEIDETLSETKLRERVTKHLEGRR